jgi:hypothetical protein
MRSGKIECRDVRDANAHFDQPDAWNRAALAFLPRVAP